MLVTLKNNHGFTLLELTVVLVIVILLFGGLLTPLSQKLEQEDRQRTGDYLQEVRESIVGFALINGRLPCPDCPDGSVGTCAGVAAANRNDGIGDMSGAAGDMVCVTSVGNVPWVDLQVDEFDAWNRHVTYAVTEVFADETDGADGCDTTTVGISFELCAQGDIDIYAAYAAPGSYGTPTVAEDVIAVLVSHGSDGYEPEQSDIQVENYDRNPVNPETGNNILDEYTGTDYSSDVFIMRDYQSEGSDAFDDMVIWLSPNILMHRMVISGQLP